MDEVIRVYIDGRCVDTVVGTSYADVFARAIAQLPGSVQDWPRNYLCEEWRGVRV